MPVVTAIVALLVSVASFVFAVLVYADNRRLEREKHRAVALSATHTASLLLQEAMDMVRQSDALFETSVVDLDEETVRRYEDYRRSVHDDHAAITRAMSEVAYGNLAVIEARALAARSTLIVYRTVDNRRTLLDILTSLRATIPEPSSPARAVPGARPGAVPGGDTGPPSVAAPEWSATPGRRPRRRVRR